MTRVLVALCICFGPVLGAALAGVMYGSKDPLVQAHGSDIRRVSTWVSDCAGCLWWEWSTAERGTSGELRSGVACLVAG